jgi:hypothetical protein
MIEYAHASKSSLPCSSSTLTILLSDAEELNKIYRGIGQSCPYVDKHRISDLAFVLLFVDVVFRYVWCRKRPVSWRSVRSSGIFNSDTHLLDQLLLPLLNFNDLGLHRILCNELIDMNRFLLADTVNPVDRLTLDSLLNNEGINSHRHCMTGGRTCHQLIPVK